MSSTNRRSFGSGPVSYIPKRKRFHGAFEGGFSAGYFNTVGSKDGFSVSKERTRQQSRTDFMDDQDHNEWGGPTHIKQQYRQQQHNQRGQWDMNRNVGQQLLRLWGWRQETGNAYVREPISTKTNTTAATEQTNKTSSLSSPPSSPQLSFGRIRRIRLEQKKHGMALQSMLPPPKLDTGGLGFDVFQDAPEFQAFRNRKQRRQQPSKTYRISSIFPEENHHATKQSRKGSGRNNNNNNNDDDDDDTYLQREQTLQDFIGSKTSAGFAIREDDDDVYDDTHIDGGGGGVQSGEESQYNTEIVDEPDSDHDGGGKPNNKHAESLTGLFSSWAGGDRQHQDGRIGDTTVPTDGVTSDGRPLLPGFVLGSSIIAGTTTRKNNRQQQQPKRYPGPKIPPNYTLRRHVFRDDELPERNKAPQAVISTPRHNTASKLQQQQQQQQQPQLNTSGTFAGLAAAIQSRFTSSNAIVTTEKPQYVGLYRPSQVAKQAGVSNDDNVAVTTGIFSGPEDIRIVDRTVVSFVPESLLCKRLGVSEPQMTQLKQQQQQKQEQRPVFKEASYFEQEILKQASRAPKPSAKQAARESVFNDDDEVEPQTNRPDMTVYKSIFGEGIMEEEEENESKRGDENDDINNEKQAEKRGEKNDRQSARHSVKSEGVEETVKDTEPMVADSSSPQMKEQSIVVATSRGIRESSRDGKSWRKKRRKTRRASESPPETDLDASSDDDGGGAYEKEKEDRRRSRKRRKDRKRRRRREEEDDTALDGHSSETEDEEKRRHFKREKRRKKRKRRKYEEVDEDSISDHSGGGERRKTKRRRSRKEEKKRHKRQNLRHHDDSES